jgi:PAS domain S-box-containing protein
MKIKSSNENQDIAHLKAEIALLQAIIDKNHLSSSNTFSGVFKEESSLNFNDGELEERLKEIAGYKRILDESSIVAITDLKGIINYANDNFCKISKYSRDELIGKSHSIVNSGFHPKSFMQDLWQTISSGHIWKGEIKNKAKDGSIYWVDTTIAPFFDLYGKIYQYVAVRTDVTAKKLLAQYSISLIEASRDPLVTINTDGKITDLNAAMIKVTGISRDKILGTYFKDYFTEPTKAFEVCQEVFDKGFVADYPMVIKDHKLTDVLFNGSTYKDDRGNILGAVIVARDITEQNKNQSELMEAKVFAELATELAEVAKEKAEDAAKSKQQFLSNMSHEIRTPMNAIIGFTKVLLKTSLSDKQKEYLDAIKISGDALIVLINDILDLAKVDAGKMSFEKTPFKMASSISSMLHLFELRIQEKNLQLIKVYDESIPKILIGDPIRLHQIILNLVSNALKFTNRGNIIVEVKLLSEDDEKVRIAFSVKDTGIGIVDYKLEKIFENFQQASHGTSRLYGGTGLGLAIVKQLVEAQGGVIDVKSRIDEGSTFTFQLEFYKSKDVEVKENHPITVDEKNTEIKVLVVEDIPLNQLLMKTLLDDFGFQRDIASNGKVAIEKLKTNTYDVILMDLQMPEMNGFEATEYIRNVMNLTIPIIALTADVTTVDLKKCTQVGMNDYIAKPVDEKLLYNKIINSVKKINLKSMEATINLFGLMKCTDLTYLLNKTKSNPALMMEMIALYLEQTPVLVLSMNESLRNSDWQMLNAAIHKMIPSFSIVGIDKRFEEVAKRIQAYSLSLNDTKTIHDLVSQIDKVCTQACEELKLEYNKLKHN